tara:strand:- start:169 stop:738 length:570 start_codon:yes stop_codon:yes gene_type:complete
VSGERVLAGCEVKISRWVRDEPKAGLRNEIMRPVIGYEGLYSVTTTGRVYSHWGDKWLRPGVGTHGYLVVALNRRGSKKSSTVHRLVALAFLGQSDLPVNHKDGVKTNNRVENLEFISHRENAIHAHRLGLSRVTGRAVRAIALDGSHERRYESMMAAQRDGFNNSNVGEVARGNRMSHKGYRWEYADA